METEKAIRIGLFGQQAGLARELVEVLCSLRGSRWKTPYNRP